MNVVLWIMICWGAMKAMPGGEYPNCPEEQPVRKCHRTPTERGQPAEHSDGACGQKTDREKLLLPCACADSRCLNGHAFRVAIHGTYVLEFLLGANVANGFNASVTPYGSRRTRHCELDHKRPLSQT